MVCLLLVARLAARPRDDVLHPLSRPRAPGPVLLVVVVTRDVEIHLEMAELSQRQLRVTSIVELETKAIRRFVKISQSQRRPLLDTMLNRC